MRHNNNEEQFEFTSKRRRGFPSEKNVKRGERSLQTPIGMEKEFL